MILRFVFEPPLPPFCREGSSAKTGFWFFPSLWLHPARGWLPGLSQPPGGGISAAAAWIWLTLCTARLWLVPDTAARFELIPGAAVRLAFIPDTAVRFGLIPDAAVRVRLPPCPRLLLLGCREPLRPLSISYPMVFPHCSKPNTLICVLINKSLEYR